jgi:hypothetical protein
MPPVLQAARRHRWPGCNSLTEELQRCSTARGTTLKFLCIHETHYQTLWLLHMLIGMKGASPARALVAVP